jgi:3-oxoacyl-[acyl-carrier protein] reductase
VAGTSRSKIAGQGVTINNLLPGKFDTDRIRSTLPAMAQKAGKTVDELRVIHQAQIPAGRYGNPQEFGAICAFLCSQHAAYMTGQNVLADGGSYAGTF